MFPLLMRFVLPGRPDGSRCVGSEREPRAGNRVPERVAAAAEKATTTEHALKPPVLKPGERSRRTVGLLVLSPLSPRGGGRESNPPASSRPHTGFEDRGAHQVP